MDGLVSEMKYGGDIDVQRLWKVSMRARKSGHVSDEWADSDNSLHTGRKGKNHEES